MPGALSWNPARHCGSCAGAEQTRSTSPVIREADDPDAVHSHAHRGPAAVGTLAGPQASAPTHANRHGHLSLNVMTFGLERAKYPPIGVLAHARSGTATMAHNRYSGRGASRGRARQRPLPAHRTMPFSQAASPTRAPPLIATRAPGVRLRSLPSLAKTRDLP